MLKVLKLGVIRSLRSVEGVKPNGNWKPKKFELFLKLLRLPITIRFNTFNTS